MAAASGKLRIQAKATKLKLTDKTQKRVNYGRGLHSSTSHLNLSRF
jgi:hypothetical protein